MPIKNLPKDPSISIRLLDLGFECPVKGTDLSQSMYLQKCILDELESKGKHGYVLEKTTERVIAYMQNHFVYGIFRKKVVEINGEDISVEDLIAQVTVYVPRDDEPFQSDIEGFEKYGISSTDLIMIKGLEVSESARGKGYAKVLISLAHSLAKEYDRKHVITDIAFANMESLAAFIHSGYVMLDAFHPVDDVQLAIVYANLDKTVDHKHEFEIDADDYTAVKNALDDGFYVSEMIRGSDKTIYRVQQDNYISGLKN
jgi:GNAT superfamily N-acetyltransferase